MINESTPETKMVSLDVEIQDDLLFELMKRAHEANVTLNSYIQVLIEDYLDELEGKGSEE